MNTVFTKKKKNISTNVYDMEIKLTNVLRKRFNVRAQLRIGQLKQTHLLKQMRREVARMKFYLLEKSLNVGRKRR